MIDQKEYIKAYHAKNKEKSQKYKREHYLRNREVILERVKQWVKDNPEARKRNLLKATYNITLEEYNQMFEDQNGCCKICGIHNSEAKRGLVVDHCHDSLKVRGLLCQKCNSALGFSNDDISILRNMIKYLEENAERTNLAED